MQTPRPPARVEPALPSIPVDPGDGILDLTDRRRILLQAVFGVDVTDADEIFEAPPVSDLPQSSSMTIRSGGRSSSTVSR